MIIPTNRIEHEPVMPLAVPERIAGPGAAPSGSDRLYVWDVLVRVLHWVIALSIVLLASTGIYLGHPFLIVPGEAGRHFVMGTVKVIHFYVAIAFTLAVLARIVWMFLGSKNARWTSFIPTTRKRWADFIGTLKFYLFIHKTPPECEGHNPLAGAAYTAIFGLYLVMILTGLGLYAADATVGTLVHHLTFLLAPFGGPQSARWVHHVVMWLLLGFTVHHVYSAVLVSLVEKNGTVDSIFSGYKWFRRRERP